MFAKLRKRLQYQIQYLYENYKHLLLLLYFCIYLPWFGYVEKTVTTHFHVIHVPLDDYIPFYEYFVIPYLLWFGYVAWGIAYMALHNKSDYYKLCTFLFTGMTIFLHTNRGRKRPRRGKSTASSRNNAAEATAEKTGRKV